MKTWRDFEKEAKAGYEATKQDIEEMGTLADIVTIILSRQEELGRRQKELADLLRPQDRIMRDESKSRNVA